VTRNLPISLGSNHPKKRLPMSVSLGEKYR